MAKIETATLNSFKDRQVNISFTVGTGEKNEKNDVMLIQALLKLVGFTEYQAKKIIGMSQKELPEITGNFCAKTRHAIWSFQRAMAKKLINIDGRVHPADYKNRVIKIEKHPKNNKFMMITLLNLYAADAVVFTDSIDIIDALKKFAPKLVFASSN